MPRRKKSEDRRRIIFYQKAAVGRGVEGKVNCRVTVIGKVDGGVELLEPVRVVGVVGNVDQRFVGAGFTPDVVEDADDWKQIVDAYRCLEAVGAPR